MSLIAGAYSLAFFWRTFCFFSSSLSEGLQWGVCFLGMHDVLRWGEILSFHEAHVDRERNSPSQVHLLFTCLLNSPSLPSFFSSLLQRRTKNCFLLSFWKKCMFDYCCCCFWLFLYNCYFTFVLKSEWQWQQFKAKIKVFLIFPFT